jgi:tripartite-type tricarboxylate transporter receptor subunit TctC
MKNISAVLGFLLASLALPGHASAQSYPNQTVRIVVPFAAGGAVDSVARIIGAKLAESWGQSVVIENKPGAGGNIAADLTAKAAPDGYTILLTTNGMAISPALYRSLPFDAVKDFTPVTQLIESPLLLVASNNLQVSSLKELIALAKAKPGTLNYGSTGVGNPLHLSMEMLKRETGMDAQAVPYRGDAPLNTALIAGEVHLAIVPIATGRANVENKLVRGLAVTTSQRSKMMPDMPTIAEQGVPGFDTSSWQGLFVPAKTPPEVVTKIYQETKKALASPDVQERLRAFAAAPIGSAPDVFVAKFKADLAKYARVVKEAKIPMQD